MQRQSATAKPADNSARQEMLIPICPSLFDDLMTGGRLGASRRELQNRRALIKAASGVVEPKTYSEYFPSQ
jgi:3-deoxy-D-arabino-heptulosonate 7-phosphate (DAHP) synthase